MDENFLFNLFETDDIYFSKFNQINSSFAYLFDVYPDGSVHFDDNHTNMSCSVQAYAFNLGTSKNPKNIQIASDMSASE